MSRARIAAQAFYVPRLTGMLELLARDGQLRVATVAPALGFHLRTATRLLHRLEHQGCVSKASCHAPYVATAELVEVGRRLGAL